MLNLSFKAQGTINVTCDVSGETFDQEIEAELPLIVKFGEEYNDENEEVLILPYSEFQLNVAQYIYEMIVLSLPSKRVHPKVLDGSMESEALKRLEQLRVKEQKPTENVDIKWHIQREKYRKLEEIREELITKLAFLKLPWIQQLVNLTYITELTGMRVNYTTEVRLY